MAEEVRRLPLEWTVALVCDDRDAALGAALRAAFAHAGYVAAPADVADAIVFVAPMHDDATAESGARTLRAAFDALRARADAFERNGGAFITVQDAGGDFGVSGRARDGAWNAGLPGLVKTMVQEWPNAIGKSIDVERGTQTPSALAERLLAEILHGGTELEVGLRADGRRTTIIMDAAPAVIAGSTRAALDASSVVVASGGARGVTAAALIALARATGAHFALLGRTPLGDEPSSVAGCTTEEALKRQLLHDAKAKGATVTPRELHRQAAAILNAREVRETLAALEAAGGKAAYFDVDIQDEAALHRALDTVRARWGGIHAIVHGAGVIADKPIARKTPEEFDRVVAVKMQGLHNLLAATRNDDLRAICLFSSIVARTGNIGQADYAAANAVLDAVAAAEGSRRGSRTVVKSINWGPWDGGMVTPGVAERFRTMGMSLIPLDVGAQAFVDEILGRAGPAVGVVLV